MEQGDSQLGPRRAGGGPATAGPRGAVQFSFTCSTVAVFCIRELGLLLTISSGWLSCKKKQEQRLALCCLGLGMSKALNSTGDSQLPKSVCLQQPPRQWRANKDSQDRVSLLEQQQGPGEAHTACPGAKPWSHLTALTGWKMQFLSRQLLLPGAGAGEVLDCCHINHINLGPVARASGTADVEILWRV